MKWTDEQLAAINKDHTSIIVSAGAGSGKTAVLTERVIRKIKDGINIDELLILTFTNKAANEMRERIRTALKKNPEFKEQLNLINQAYITTFDSFCLSILKKYHYILNLAKNIKIADNSLIFLQKQKIISEIFEDLYEKGNPNFIKLINDFCIKNDDELKENILSIYNATTLLIDKDNYLNSYIDNFFNEQTIKSHIKLFEELILSKIEQINSYLNDVANIDYDYYVKLDDALKLLLESNTYDEIKVNLQFRLPNLPKNYDDDLKLLKENINQVLKEIQSFCEYSDEQDIMNTIILTKDYIEIIIEIILRLDEQLTNYKNANNIYEFNDISILVIKMLENNPDIRLEIKQKYKEIMIDEYQDTNDIQEKFISLISSNNVYMVGDIKQSIYRFRNANPYLFKNKYEDYSNGKNGTKIDLNKNFRSRGEVLNNINLLFSKLMSSELGGANYSNGHEMIYGNKLYDDLHANKNYNMDILDYHYDKTLNFTKEEIEIFIIANDILNKIKNEYKVIDKKSFELRNCTFEDFSILVDRSTNFDLFKKIFEFMKIPLTIYKDENLNNGIEIIVIKNIIRLILKIKNNILDTDFKYLFISIARSFVAEYNDDFIFEIFNNNDFISNDIYLKCSELSKKIDTYTNSMMIAEIINIFSIFDNLIKLGDIQNRIIRLDYLSEVATNLDSMGFSIEDFSNYLDDLVACDYNIRFSLSKESPNSVQLMTIHASKGLEFNICYFPLLYKDFNLRELSEKFLFDKDYGIIAPYFREGIGKTILKYLVKNKYVKEEISEKIRLFYVALTRAKENMILVADLGDNNSTNVKEKMSFRSFLDMLKFLGNDLNGYKKKINFDDFYFSHDYNLTKKVADLNKFRSMENDFVVKDLEFDKQLEQTNIFSKNVTHFISKEEQKNLNIGTYFHYLLEIIDFKKKDIDNYSIDDFYKQRIINFLNLDIFKNLKTGTIYKEYEFIEIIDNVKNHGIIDLMVEYDNYVDIIDYKFKNVDDEAYIKQLKGYKNYIERKLSKKVNLYLYSIINEKLKNVE